MIDKLLTIQNWPIFFSTFLILWNYSRFSMIRSVPSLVFTARVATSLFIVECVGIFFTWNRQTISDFFLQTPFICVQGILERTMRPLGMIWSLIIPNQLLISRKYFTSFVGTTSAVLFIVAWRWDFLREIVNISLPNFSQTALIS